jgi:hypothetical protein
MNRNILVEEDFPELVLESGSDDPRVPTPDGYLGKLIKYIPVEIIGSYLIISGLLESAYASATTARRVSLGLFFILGILVSYAYAKRVLHVVRASQLAMTSLAFAVWVFAAGGVFATLAWWHPWMGTIAVVMFGVLVRIVGLGPLPEEPPSPEPLLTEEAA